MKNIIQLEEDYWHIPKISLLPILGLILFILLAIGNFQLIDKDVMGEVFKSYEDCVYNLTSPDLINLYPIIGEYILISLALISLVAIFKKGYKNLKSYTEKGLIISLIMGLIGSLILSLICGLIIGLIMGLICSLIDGLIIGLIMGLIIGLIYSLIMGLIYSLTEEFE